MVMIVVMVMMAVVVVAGEKVPMARREAMHSAGTSVAQFFLMHGPTEKRMQSHVGHRIVADSAAATTSQAAASSRGTAVQSVAW
jgi:hypothetical protein